MDWPRLRFDWNRARAFLATAELGSMSAAARVLGAAQPTLSRQVAALEHELRVRLFEREGGGLQLTAAGLELLEHVRAMGDAAASVTAVLAHEPRAVAGHVAVRAAPLMGAYVVLPVVERLQERHPKLEVSFVDDDLRRALPWHGVDIQLAHALPVADGLRVERVQDAQLGLYGAIELARKLKGSSPREVANTPVLGFEADDRTLQELARRGFRPAGSRPLQAQDPLLNWQLLQRGHGLGLLPEAVAAGAAGLSRVLPEVSLRQSQWLACPAAALARTAVASVFEALLAALA